MEPAGPLQFVSEVAWALSVIVMILMVPMLFGGFFPSTTHYSYEVKAQQVEDTDRVEAGDVVQLENLSEDEQELLYHAFKKTDHFMGASSVVLNYQDQRLDTFTDWRTVESNGVLLLVAVNEQTEQVRDRSKYEWYHKFIHFYGFYSLVGWIPMKFFTALDL
jgi:hypothetical protein